LGNIANITISGGSNSQVITTDGAGNLSFSNQTPLLNVALSNASNVLSNNISSVTTLSFDIESGFDVTDQGNGVARVAMNSTFKYWEVDGQPGLTATGLDTVNFLTGSGISITANGSNTPQSIEFKVDAAGNSGELQFNIDGNLGAANNITWSTVSNVLEIDGSIDLYGDLWFEAGSNIRSGGTLNIEPNLTFGGNSLTLANNTTFTGNGITTFDTDVKFDKTSNLGNVANVTITGGNNGFYLQTDGGGNLAWVSGGGSGNGETGGSNTQVQFNDGGNFGGSSAFTFNKTTNTLAVTGNLTVSSGIANIGTVANVKILGGSDGQFLQTNGSGTLTWGDPQIANINRPSILFNVASNGNAQTFTDANLTVFGNNNTYAQLFFNGVLMNTSEYSLSGNVLTINRYLHTNDQLVVGPLVQSVIVPGANTQIVFNNSGNFDAVEGFTYDTVANLVTVSGNMQATNFLGTLANGNSNVNIAAANGNITLSVAGNSNVMTVTGTGANITGNTTVGNLTVNGNISYDKTYGCFHKMANITAPAANTVYNFDWYTDTTAHVGDQGVTVTSGQPTRINIDRAGEYTAVLEMQAQNTGNGERIAWIWLAKNGTDISETRIQVDLLKEAKQIITKLWLLDDVVANDYFEVRFAVNNVTDISLGYEPVQTTPFNMPAQPSATITIVPVGA
jgi:hypothetical protein